MPRAPTAEPPSTVNGHCRVRYARGNRPPSAALRLAQVLLCQSGCCGHAAKGTAPVPVDWLRARWKALSIGTRVSLAITGCLGPCDVANVACIVHAQGSWWLGRLTADDYALLVAWADACREQLAELPAPLAARRFARWND